LTDDGTFSIRDLHYCDVQAILLKGISSEPLV
jgi:hypothetical protein